jgi:argonaute-like protein implicated in RNA metabolism and viral defense
VQKFEGFAKFQGNANLYMYGCVEQKKAGEENRRIQRLVSYQWIQTRAGGTRIILDKGLETKWDKGLETNLSMCLVTL